MELTFRGKTKRPGHITSITDMNKEKTVMNTFYAQLFADGEENLAYIQLLKRLTNVSLPKLRTLKIEFVWEIWA